MRRDEAERLLAGLGAAYDRIAAGMYAVDQHPGLVLLRSGKLAGETEARARAVRPEVDLLWAHFTVLGNLLGRLRDICGRRRATDEEWAELERLMREPVVLLDPAGMPLDGPGTVAQRLRVAELAEQVERRCAGVTAHLSEVDTAWTVVAGRLARDAEAADALTSLAKTLGQPDAVAGVDRGFAEISALDASDPLTAAPGGRIAGAAAARFDRLEAELAAARTRLSELDGVRQGYPRRVDELRALVGKVAQEEQTVAQAYRRAAEKIVDPGLAPLPTASAVLTTRLAELDRLGQSGHWSRLAADLSTVEESAHRSLSRAAELRALADGLVDRRDELRGRLSAYREKAARHGLAEDEELAVGYERARELLYTAPCDLRAGTRAVYDYQTAIARLLSEGGIRHG